ncbi:initiator RepB protein, partial [Enterococcus faecalis]|nr:initiator RepB protein [Enterococcus faecalis]
PTKEEQNRALAQADKQKEYEQQPTTIDEKILEAKRKVELLEQLKELEKKEKQDTKNQTPTEQKKSKSDSQLSEKDKQDLLNGLSNFGK